MASSLSFRVEWTKVDALPDPQYGFPMARSSHGFTSVSPTRMVLYGGEHVARTPLPREQALWFCDFDGDAWKWRALNPEIAPPARVAHAQSFVKGKLYIYGGRSGIEMGETTLLDLWFLDVEKESWHLVEHKGEDVPEGRSFHAMVSSSSDNSNDLYVFGGCGVVTSRLADLYKFDTTAETWTNCTASPLLKGRGGPNVFMLPDKKKIAVVAGFCGFESKDGHVYDLETQSWKEEGLQQELEKMRPRSVCVHGYLPCIDKAVVFGGEVDPSDRGHEGAGGFEHDIVLLDGTTMEVVASITKGDDNEVWPEQRGWSAGTVVANEDESNRSSLYFFGGLTGDDENPKRLADFWKCNVVAIDQ